MSLVTPPQRNGYLNGSTETNGAIGHAPTLVDGLNHMNLPGNAAQAFDFWGFLQRRKYLIALFCIIGAIIGTNAMPIVT